MKNEDSKNKDLWQAHLAASEKVTDSIQAALGHLAEKYREGLGDAVADGLNLWKEKIRAESVGAWLAGHYADYKKKRVKELDEMKAAGAVMPDEIDLREEWGKTWPKKWKEACKEYHEAHEETKPPEKRAVLVDPKYTDPIKKERAARWARLHAEKKPTPEGQKAYEERQANLEELNPGLIEVNLDLISLFVMFNGGTSLLSVLGKPDTPPRWLLLLLAPWVEEEAERLDKLETERAKREKQKEKAVPFAVQPRNMVKIKNEAAFLRFPSALTDAGAWGREMVEVDGAAFADEPKLERVRIYQPRAWSVAPESLMDTPNGQLVFPGFDLNPETNPDLACFLSVAAGDAVATMKDAGKVCAKLLPLLFAMCPLDGTPIQGTYDELRKLVYPDYKDRRAAHKDRERVGAATAALHSLRLVARMNNNRARVLPLLAGGYYDTYTKDDLEAGAIFRLNPELLKMVIPTKGAGFFLVNLSQLLALDAKDPVSIAVALRIYAYWHNCKQRGYWMPDRLRPLDVDALLVTANAVNQRTAETISGRRVEQSDLVQLSKARAALVDKTLPKLVAAGIMDPKTLDAVRRPTKGSRGKGWLVTPEPPLDYLEASKKATRLTRKPERKKKG